MSANQGAPPSSDALHKAVQAGDVGTVRLLAAHEELLNRRRSCKGCTGAVTPLELAVTELVGGAGRRESGAMSSASSSCRGML